MAPDASFRRVGGHDRGEKPEFTSLLRSDTPECPLRCDRSSLPEQHEQNKKRPCDPIFLNIHPAIEFLGSNLWHLLSNAVNPSSAFAKNGAVDADNFVVGEDFAENAHWPFVFFTPSGDGDKNAFVADVKVHVR